MNSENSKTNKSNRSRYYFTNKFNLKNPNMNIALVTLNIYYSWKNIRSDCRNNKFKIHAPTWNEAFD